MRGAQAAAAGARVLLLERAAATGGTSRWPAATSTSAAAPRCSRPPATRTAAEEMYKYLVAVSNEPEHDKIRAYCEGSVEHFDWLEALGFEFERQLLPGEGGHPARHRGADVHRQREGVAVQGPGRCRRRAGTRCRCPATPAAPSMVIDLLLKRADELGVADALRDRSDGPRSVDDGAVVGVAWKHFDETGAIRAKAVVIAAGGFVMNPEMVAAHTPTARREAVRARQDIRRRARHPARSVGRRRRQAHGPGFITAPFYPPSILLTGIIVNKLGQRFVAEDSYHSRTSDFVMEQPDHAAYLIVDRRTCSSPSFR